MAVTANNPLSGSPSEPTKARAEKKSELLIDRPAQSTKPARGKFFVLVAIGMTLSPMLLGLSLGNFAPKLPSLSWTLLIEQRTSALAESTHVPKIIFVGGSNL